MFRLHIMRGRGGTRLASGNTVIIKLTYIQSRMNKCPPSAHMLSSSPVWLLVTGWLQVGYRLVSGWLLVGYWLVTGDSVLSFFDDPDPKMPLL